MKLTKKQETEIWQVYDTWLNSYLNGDVETYDSFLDDDYHFIGSATKEEFLNRKDTTNFFADTGDQFAGKTEIRNESKIIEQFGELIFITHVLDGWFLHENDWNFYSRFRFSSILRKNKDGWRFIYQHFSIPDPKTAEGETIGYDKINEENQELREAIQRRTFELEQKNRELEVETALERIRAQAVAMKESSDLLDIVVTMRNEFIKLGHEAHYFWHMMWLPETYEKAMTSGDGSKIGFVMELPRHIHGDIPQLAKWEKSKKPTVVYTMNVEEAIYYVDKMVALGNFKSIDPQAPSHDDIKHIGGLTFIMARTTHGEIGYSLPGIVNKPPKEDIDILVKFASAFDLAHQRFLDLQKAEKQARETQIELSLERIRSRVTAMQESSELFDIVVTMRNEFLSLGHEADYFWHMKWTKDNYEMSMTAEDGGRLGMVITVPKFVHEQIESLHKWEESNSPYFVLALNGKDAWDYIEKMNTYGKYKLVDPHAPTEEDILHIGGLTFIIARTTHGEIGFSLAGKIDNPPKASIDILVRFASVFDLAYKRFEDLKKAEAQTRETQIELALEKVRSRTMAMQHSDELQEASFLLDQQVRALGIKTWGCAFNIYGENESTEWFGNEAGVLHTYTVPREGIFKDYYDKGLKGETLAIQEFSGDNCVAHYEYMSSLPVIGDVLKTLKKTNNGFPTYQIDHVVYFKYGYLLFITREHVPDSHDIFKRFAKVFEQTYTRFLDLQKAEAQAKEAQIEAALERTRTQSMLMQHSDELDATSKVFHKQLQLLGIDTEFSYVWLPDEAKNEHQFWVAWNSEQNKENTNSKAIVYPLDKTEPYTAACFKDWSSGITVHIHHIKPKEVKNFFSVWEELLKEAKNLTPKYFSNGLYYAEAFMKYGCFGINIKRSITEEEKQILQRFSIEFERTYTRFLDLKRAEAQAKEAQIEAALERVRSRSMAMHKSEEIGDVAFVLFEQLKSLGGELWGTGFGFCKTDSKIDEFWFANENDIMPHLKIPNDVDEAHKKMYQGWKKNLESFSIAKEGKELKDHYKYMLSVPDVKPIFQGMLDNGIKFPKWQKWHAAYYKYGYLLVITTEEYKNETIFKRFAKVFEQAYTRFLDLKKAEAQAREAQIEAALERVRSQSMGMQTSKDFSNVTTEMFNQLRQFGGDLFATGIVFCDKHEGHVEQWHSIPNAGMMSPFIVPIDLDYIHQYRYDQWKKGTELFEIEIPSDFIEQHFNDIFNLPTAQKVLKDFEDQNTPMPGAPPWEIDYGASFKHGYLLVSSLQPFKEAEILPRFAKVFEQAYTRFLDLQKAEAQAREAQIEAALEKVRSRTMAMQKGEELKDVVVLLYKELIALGVTNFATCGYVEINEKTNLQSTWVTNPGGDSLGLFYLPLTGDIHFDERYEAWKKQQTVFHQTVAGKERRKHLEYAITTFNSKEAEEMVLNQFPDPTVFYCFNFSHGYLHLVSGSYLKEEEETLLARFTKVFEQTYARFLDLEKAEAQAREAQIETALERVRSRSMAMHKSEEFKEVIQVVYDQFVNLNINIEHAGFILDYKENDDMHIWLADHNAVFPKIVLPYFDCAHWNSFIEAKNEGRNFFANQLGFEEKNKFYKDLFEHIPELPEETKKTYFGFDGLAISTVLLENIGLYIENYSGIPFSEDENNILMRFGKVFDQAYTRFLDLQKAEAQAREAQIEMALEKVRSRTMAMQNSNELPEAANNLFLQVQELGIPAWSAGYCIWEDNQKSAWCNMSSEGEIQKGFSLPTIGEGYNFYKPLKNKEPFHVAELGGKKLVKHYDFMKKLPIVGEILKDFDEKGIELPTFQIFHIVYFSHGYLMFITYEAVQNDWEVFKRFGKVFQQTFTRFLDLQKAEEQTRTAQINLAVERVRAKALAMHKSEEIIDVVAKLKNEVMNLEIPDVVAATIFLNEADDNVRMWDLSSLEQEDNYSEIPFDLTFKIKKTDPHLYVKRVWENPKNYFVEVQDKKGFKRLMEWLREQDKNKFADEIEEFIEKTQLKRLYHTAKKLDNGKLVIDLLSPPSDEMETILTKMGAAFDLAYKRFEDLKKAEAQTREAQIEAALEKVRSRSLAMHKPDELQEVVAVVAEKLQELGVIYDAGGVILCTYFPDNKDVVHWIAVDDFSTSGRYFVPYFDNPIFSEAWDSKNRGDAYFSKEFSVEAKNDFFKQAFEHSDYRQMPDNYKQFVLQADSHNLSAAWSKNSAIIIPSLTGAVPSESDAEIMKRFAKVFEQAYIRFMDLQKAEAQARESLISTGLERVRSRTLAMQNSNELAETSVVVFQQLLELGIAPNRLFIGIVKENGLKIDAWATNEDGSKLASYFTLQASENKSIKKMLAGWKQQKKSLIIDMKGKELQEYFQYLNKDMEIPFIDGLKQKRRVQTIAYFSGGLIGMAAPEEQPKETIDLLERFAAVFNLTYTRFNDLKVAEAQAREAKIEGALERVRARALAMQQPEELKDVAKVLRHEMGLLDIEELETCSIYINDRATKKTECWYAIKDIRSKKQKLINDHFELNLKDTWVGREMQKFYKSKSKEVSIVMAGKNRKEWIDYCEIHSKPFKGYYGEKIPERTYHLYKFSHGAIGVATPGDISDENWSLIKRTASVFSLAYSRFKDLTQARLDLAKLKEEKKRAEEALSELQLTQTQLIQSEKMASLGELTAGIAHEIQNPLNFVNNFSEVSKELLDEMLEEIENGDMEEVKAIMDDVIQNLEKINHHGKRADGIVKGMLQHSRSSTGNKEPANINTLADEYLRLAYHGLRAKDKSFNANLVTDFDDTIGTVNIIPQDIGRVILNLLTNAFYACTERSRSMVNEKNQLNIKDYEPTVILTTKKNGNMVAISVKDNGNGIPQKVLDKIFQPFFTTKPTGQGTGLGLSMSYDIVTKGHGGELKVDTKQGEGTEFNIILPIKS